MRSAHRSSITARWIPALVLSFALAGALAAAEDREVVEHDAIERSVPPAGEGAYAHFRAESSPAYEEAGGPALDIGAVERSEIEGPPSRREEDRLPPEGSAIDLGWWRVGLDWRRHPGVCLIDP